MKRKVSFFVIQLKTSQKNRNPYILPSPQLLFHADNNHHCSFTLDQIKSHPWMMAEVRWRKKKPIRNLSSQVPSTASLATVRSPAPDAGTINEQVFLSFNKYLSLAQLGILVWDNHRGGQAPQSYLLNEKLDWILKNVFVRFSGWCSPWELTLEERKRWASGLVFDWPTQLFFSWRGGGGLTKMAF